MKLFGAFCYFVICLLLFDGSVLVTPSLAAEQKSSTAASAKKAAEDAAKIKAAEDEARKKAADAAKKAAAQPAYTFSPTPFGTVEIYKNGQRISTATPSFAATNYGYTPPPSAPNGTIVPTKPAAPTTIVTPPKPTASVTSPAPPVVQPKVTAPVGSPSQQQLGQIQKQLDAIRAQAETLQRQAAEEGAKKKEAEDAAKKAAVGAAGSVNRPVSPIGKLYVTTPTGAIPLPAQPSQQQLEQIQKQLDVMRLQAETLQRQATEEAAKKKATEEAAKKYATQIPPAATMAPSPLPAGALTAADLALRLNLSMMNNSSASASSSTVQGVYFGFAPSSTSPGIVDVYRNGQVVSTVTVQDAAGKYGNNASKIISTLSAGAAGAQIATTTPPAKTPTTGIQPVAPGAQPKIVVPAPRAPLGSAAPTRQVTLPNGAIVTINDKGDIVAGDPTKGNPAVAAASGLQVQVKPAAPPISSRTMPTPVSQPKIVAPIVPTPRSSQQQLDAARVQAETLQRQVAEEAAKKKTAEEAAKKITVTTAATTPATLATPSNVTTIPVKTPATAGGQASDATPAVRVSNQTVTIAGSTAPGGSPFQSLTSPNFGSNLNQLPDMRMAGTTPQQVLSVDPSEAIQRITQSGVAIQSTIDGGTRYSLGNGSQVVVNKDKTGATYEPGKLVQNLAILSSSIYGGTDDLPPPAGSTVLKQYSDPATDFKATAYRLPDKQVIVVYAGTDSLIGKDGLADLYIVTNSAQRPDERKLNILNQQIRQARTFYEDTVIEAAKEHSRISVVTGHSLGGALAQVVGIEQGVSTETFNAPGMELFIEEFKEKNPDYEKKSAQIKQTQSINITNHVRKTDIVGNFRQHVGNLIEYSANNSADHDIAEFATQLNMGISGQVTVDKNFDTLAGGKDVLVELLK